MPKKDGVRLVRDFLLKHLHENTFGEELEWIDEKSGKFGMTWMHKSNGKWIQQKHGAVYEAWAKRKNLWDSKDPKAISKAKQRLRSALRKLPNVRSLGCIDNYRTYDIINISELRQQQYESDSVRSPLYDSGYESNSSPPPLVERSAFDLQEEYVPNWATENDTLETITQQELQDLPPLPFGIEFESSPAFY